MMLDWPSGATSQLTSSAFGLLWSVSIKESAAPVLPNVIYIEDNDLEDEPMQKLMKPVAVATSDSNFENATMGDGTSAEYICVGAAGAVKFVLQDGSTWTAPNIASGAFYWMPPFRGIYATGTTATGIFVTRRY